MRMAYEAMSYTVPPEERGYYELSSAILETAVNDYRCYRKAEYDKGINSLRRFFLSEIFENLSGVDNPSAFLAVLDEQIDRENREGIRRKRAKQTMKCNG